MKLEMLSMKLVLSTYTGETYSIQPMEVVENIPVSLKGQEEKLSIVVMSGTGPSFLGKDWMRDVKLDWNEIFGVHKTKISEGNAKLHALLDTCPELFKYELGYLKGTTVTIHLEVVLCTQLYGRSHSHLKVKLICLSYLFVGKLI